VEPGEDALSLLLPLKKKKVILFLKDQNKITMYLALFNINI